MRTKYITVGTEKFMIEFPCIIEDEKTYVVVHRKSGDHYYWLGTHYLKTYYRHERTWDDHMGNTPCGYFVNVPLLGKTKRVYVH